MTAIILPSRFGSRQPQQVPPIDWGNPITRALTFAALPHGNSFISVLTGKTGTPSGTVPPTIASGVGGRSLLITRSSITATNSYIDFGIADKNTADLALSASTWFFWARPNATPAGGLAERNDANSVNAGWLIGIDSSTKLFFSKEFSSSNLSVVSNTAVVANVDTSYAVTHDGSGTGASSCGLYIGGADAGVTLNFAGSGSTGSDTANTFYLGRNSFGNTSGNFPGNMEFVAIFRRVLSASEIASLHANRYQIFKAPQRRLWALAAAAAASGRPQVFACT